jgi:hypothetical protein
VGAPLKHQMSLEEIAAKEGTTPAAINTLLSRALRKLRNRGLPVYTCRELLEALERSRPHTEHTVRRTARRG